MPSKFVKVAALIATLSVTLLSNTAQATPLVYSSSGTIYSGTDSTGVFGAIGSLAGATYSMSITLDSSLFSYASDSANMKLSYGSITGTAKETVTVNGVTQSYILDLARPNSGEIFAKASSGLSEVYSYLDGTSTAGQYSNMEQYIYSYVNTALSSVALTSPMSYQAGAGDNGYSSFYTWGDAGIASFDAYVTSYAIQAVGTNVPEPAPLALLGLGLVALAITRRKTRA